MSKALRVGLASVCLGLLSSATARTADFNGWQGLRVIAQQGEPERMFAADLEGDGRQNLVLVNTRQSRLDLYRWVPREERKPSPAPDLDRPNELPLAPDWTHFELPLDDLPADAIAADVDGDAKLELLVLTGPALKVTIFQSESVGKWRELREHDLFGGQLTGRGRLLLIRNVGDKRRELLVSCEQGIQVLPLEKDARPTWFHPRETVPRVDWRLIDLDGDGDEDLVEWTTKANQTVRWHECVGGALRPAQALHDQTLQQLGLLTGGNRTPEVLGLGGSQSGVVRRYQLARGDESPWGRRATLPLSMQPGAPWCGLKLGDIPALVAASPDEPRLRAYRLVNDEWNGEESFPTIGNIRELSAPAAREGTLLAWVKDAADLYECRWEKDRLTYPKPMVQSGEVADRRITALGSVGTTTWWAQRVGEDLDLYVWPTGKPEPEKTRFEKAGAKVERVQWLGGKRLMVQLAYSTAAKLVTHDGKKTVVTELPQLAKTNLEEYRTYEIGGASRVGRLTGGVLQWLDDALQPVDQVMLPDGQKLSALIPAGEGEVIALEEGGQFLHRLSISSTGKVQLLDSDRISGAAALRHDRMLGVFLVDAERAARLTAGKPWELKLVDMIDGRQGRPSGVKEAVIHRFLTTDLNGDGTDEALLCDDRRHTLSALERVGGELRPLVSWQVFEDQTYPYGGGESGEATVAEPRVVVGFDADGDDHRDLALLSQDRLLIYLGREVQP